MKLLVSVYTDHQHKKPQLLLCCPSLTLSHVVHVKIGLMSADPPVSWFSFFLLLSQSFLSNTSVTNASDNGPIASMTRRDEPLYDSGNGHLRHRLHQATNHHISWSLRIWRKSHPNIDGVLNAASTRFSTLWPIHNGEGLPHEKK